jgi:hypothetical protein
MTLSPLVRTDITIDQEQITLVAQRFATEYAIHAEEYFNHSRLKPDQWASGPTQSVIQHLMKL